MSELLDGTETHADFEFALWSIDPALVAQAALAGVRWIGPDLEIIGKRERQAGTGSLISAHPPESVRGVGELVGTKRLFVRCNAPGAHSENEIERLLSEGVSCLMMPMIRTFAEAEAVAQQVGGRAKLVVMIEHCDILDDVDRVAALAFVDTLYVGTNDLALSMGYRTRFGPIAAGWVDRIAKVAHLHGRGFSFLGFARLSAEIAVPTDLVLAEYARLNVNWGLFARSFSAEPTSFARELGIVRDRLAWWKRQPTSALEEARDRYLHACREAEANGLPRR